MMASDQVLSRELKSMQEELAAVQRDRKAMADTAVQTPCSAEPISETEESGKEQGELRDQLGELADTVMAFLEDTEKDISAHPAESVAIALVAGILIGWLLGRAGGR